LTTSLCVHDDGPVVEERRTQAERRAATRTKLLEAALELLIERGYAGTTLAEVAARAGLTNGALWRHWRTKAALMADVALFCDARLTARSGRPARGASPEQRVSQTVRHLWARAHEPDFQALIELLREGRTDPELRAALQASDERAAQLFYDALAEGLGEGIASQPHFRRHAKLLGLALYGTALTAQVRTPLAERRLRAEMAELAAELFLPGTARSDRAQA
jgi:AcrR family transcriptional regulator